MTRAWSIVMTRACNIVMRTVMEHCDDKDVENFDNKVHGVL